MYKNFLDTQRKKKKDKAKAINRLTEIDTQIVSLVGCPANGEEFPIIKSLNSDASNTVTVEELLNRNDGKEPDADALAKVILDIWSKGKTIER